MSDEELKLDYSKLEAAAKLLNESGYSFILACAPKYCQDTDRAHLWHSSKMTYNECKACFRRCGDAMLEVNAGTGYCKEAGFLDCIDMFVKQAKEYPDYNCGDYDEY